MRILIFFLLLSSASCGAQYVYFNQLIDWGNISQMGGYTGVFLPGDSIVVLGLHADENVYSIPSFDRFNLEGHHIDSTWNMEMELRGVIGATNLLLGAVLFNQEYYRLWAGTDSCSHDRPKLSRHDHQGNLISFTDLTISENCSDPDASNVLASSIIAAPDRGTLIILASQFVDIGLPFNIRIFEFSPTNNSFTYQDILYNAITNQN
jgi:hypothetical protein